MQWPIECTADSDDRYTPSNNATGDPSASGTEAGSLSASATALPPDKPEISTTSFTVYFSDVRSRQTSEPFALSIAAYKHRESDHIKTAKEATKIKFINRTIARLQSMGVADKNCEMLARLVMDGKEVKFNADKDEPYSTEYIYEYYRYMLEIESYQCLLISAPADVDELTRRKEEMNIFCIQAFPAEHFNGERLNAMITYREVSNCAHVRTYIRDFFHRLDGIRAKRAIHALIVFFGHGSSEGFCAGHEDMPLDNIVSFVKDEWRQARWERPEELPVTVEIIFTQCYGHVHSQDVQSDRFKVTALTTAVHPVTTSIRDATGTFLNNDLTSYAEGPLREQVVKTEARRQSHRGVVVDLSALQASTNTGDSRPTTSTTEDSVTHAEVRDDGNSLTE